MIKTTGFHLFRPNPARYLRYHRWAGGLVERQAWGVMSFPWASVYRTCTRNEILAGNRRFRESQLGWRSYMGRAPVRRFRHNRHHD